MCKCFTLTKMRLNNANSDQLHPKRVQETNPDSPSADEDDSGEHPKRIQETYPDSPGADKEDREEYTVGKFVIVNYDNKAFVGQITKRHADNIEVNCMVQHGKRNVLKWPGNPDCIFYPRDQIISIISEPEPHQHAAQLTKYDWLVFNEV